MNTTDLHTLTGAYAMDALPDTERTAFERHLAGCEACAQETAELTATTARLGLAVSVSPRPELRDEVLRRITTVRQETPREAGAATSVPRAAARRVILSRWALAACVAAAAAFGGVAVWQHQRAEDALDQARQAEQSAEGAAAVLAAPDARSGSAKLGDGATGTVVVSKRQDRAVFVVSGMAPPPKGKTYQLWFEEDGKMRSAGLMEPGRSKQTVLMSGAVGGASGMGVTVEPAGGSGQPTSAPVALMPLPA
ncbi:anti-sigma factor [Streptomyces boluensis]|uniref:Regulator of SigK n=1 Tax=Streptomyces boluensis TaxID=1775135 RepID=A0A964XIM8_9ACTN|nr:anti-sigma factor [Streptomyces boluensis]NBE50394.1 anti-sigma factor [Streptomyces boluensis]